MTRPPFLKAQDGRPPLVVQQSAFEHENRRDINLGSTGGDDVGDHLIHLVQQGEYNDFLGGQRVMHKEKNRYCKYVYIYYFD